MWVLDDGLSDSHLRLTPGQVNAECFGDVRVGLTELEEQLDLAFALKDVWWKKSAASQVR